ncbi:MAG: hypothetical protein KUA37_17390 [Desulfomicrobium sp.]|nr:hypothetical protein [Pseudomonadota bacterium]MBV1713757.1 hypothetical protein [Desulfomicrobium sp.]MBU4572292.1 hypothetical protein [Pseudomonadota bacterium]MBU4594270.1 hypothetical protein [Pseudomonadota bacterium]MBV1721542.1 hypothetical protein [Desulfomicrobium sp.]
MKRDEEDFDELPAAREADEPTTRGKELKLFTMCLKKFIKKIFQHMVATRFASWKELAIHDQDGLAYPIYNYVLDAADPRLRQTYTGFGLEIDGGTLLADLSVSAILEEEGSIGLEFYLYETTSIVPYVCEDFEAVENERPDISHFRKINHVDFETLYDELKSSNIFDDIYYELNKSILLIELSERETLAQMKKSSLKIISGIFARAKSISNLNTITNTDIKEFKLDFEIEGRKFSLVVLNGHDADNLPVYSSVLTMPEYKSVAQYVDLDTLYEKLLKVMRAKNIADPEAGLLEALKPHDRAAQNAVATALGQ